MSILIVFISISKFHGGGDGKKSLDHLVVAERSYSKHDLNTKMDQKYKATFMKSKSIPWLS